jgi:hypothetical protein
VAVDLRAVLELIPDAALMVDSHGRVAHSNSPARALFARGGHGSARWRAWHADGRPMAAHELPTARAARGCGATSARWKTSWRPPWRRPRRS